MTPAWWSDSLAAHVEKSSDGSKVWFLCGHHQGIGHVRFAATRLGADPLFYLRCRRCLASLARLERLTLGV